MAAEVQALVRGQAVVVPVVQVVADQTADRAQDPMVEMAAKAVMDKNYPIRTVADLASKYLQVGLRKTWMVSMDLKVYDLFLMARV